MRFTRLLPVCGLFLSLSCGSQTGDEHSPTFVPPPAGKGNRIHELADPASPKKVPHKTAISVTGAVVVAIDTFDETGNGKSSGTIYVADLGSAEPYSGLSLYQPSFIPGNLRVGAGDTLDLRGEYQENQDIPIKFAPGAFLVQLSQPIGTFRFDATVPPPVEIDINDLADYAKGRQWLNMIVTVKNVTIQRDIVGPKPSTSGRLSAQLLKETNTATGCEDPFPKAPTIVNELMDLSTRTDLKEGTVIKELTGVVTFFCNLHIAPRTPDDIKL